MSDSATPIRQRFDLLHDQWVAFADDEAARVLCWRVQDDERGMLDAFLAKEEDERIGELPELFVQLDVPFLGAQAYGLALREALIAVASATDAELAYASGFRAPLVSRDEDSIGACLATCVAFHAHYQVPGHLALVLVPAETVDAQAFATWLVAVARAAPAQVRFVVVDSAAHPVLGDLPPGSGVVLQTADLDMPGALSEVSRAAGRLDTPGGMFRHLFVALTGALAQKDLAAAEQLAERVLLVTRAQGWFALEVPVHFALASALMEANRTSEALGRYVAAEGAALAGQEAGDPTCQKLHMQARMARGALLLITHAYEQATTLFVETLPMAFALSDARSVIDCHRLASFGQERAGNYRAAWQHGLDALAYARGVDGEILRSSTLPFMAEAMQRLAKRDGLRAQAPRVQREFEQLLAEPSTSAPLAPRPEAVTT